jgi:hypothetical protein
MKKLRGQGPGKSDPIPPMETSGGPRPEDAEINKFLAQYNDTRNALALWAAFRVCLQHDRPVPDGIKQFFAEIADKLLQYSANAAPQARDLVADLVLGTKNEGGGPSVFERYATYIKNRELHELTRSAMIEVGMLNKTKPPSQAKIYEDVANEAGRDIEKVRKNFEANERDLGSFAIGAVRRAKKRGGVTDL